MILALLGDHLRRDVADHEIRPAHVDRHHSVPEVGVPFVEVAWAELGIERGVVDEDVDAAEALGGLRHELLHRGFVADVEAFGDRGVLAVLAADLGRQRRTVLDIGDHHPRALFGQRPRIMRADAPGAAGDDRGLACKSGHSSSVMPALVAGIHVLLQKP